jgi:glutamate formiminotransferase / 5-formyltetrahydrofolate cyclo-ligase
VVGRLVRAAGDLLLDFHSDPNHHRAVLTICSGGTAGRVRAPAESPVEARIRQVVETAVGLIDIRDHHGVHPRIGSVDVVPFVSLRRDPDNLICDGPISEALEARNLFMAWIGATLGIPCFAYGTERSLPDVRRGAFRTLVPDYGPDSPHPTAGACAVGARPILVAYNLWLSGSDVAVAKSIAGTIRSPQVRALGFAVGGSAQVSCNLVDPFNTGPGEVFDQVARLAEARGQGIERPELVGLVPMRVLHSVPRHRRTEIGLGEDRTIESRLDAGGG